MSKGRMGCVVNPGAGHETALALEPETRAARVKTILVAGGGPAGLEFARTAALRGHEVVLHEAGKQLGGQVAMAARAPLLFIGSLSMVVMQTLVALGVFAGTISPTSSSSSQCAAGTYCKVSSNSVWSARCLWCGADPPLPMSHEGVCHSYIGSSPSAVGHRAMDFTIADSACTTYNHA